MARRKHNQRSAWPLALAIVAVLAAAGCGRRHDKGGSSDTFAVPDYMRDPSFLPVPIGSRDVVASPPAGLVKGSLLLKLFSEPAARVRYRFRAFSEDHPVESLREYTEGLVLLPPVTVWAQAEKDGVRGPVRTFAYDFDPDFWPAPARLTAHRLPTDPYSSVPPTDALTTFTALGAGERLGAVPVVDGAVGDWSGQSRLAALDGLGDVPELQSYIDMSWSEAGETDDAIYLVLAMKDKPKNGTEGVFYGIDLGPSNISFASFGAGTNFLYRAEITKGGLVLQDKATGAALPAPGSSLFIGNVIEIKLAKADMPLLAGATDLTIRPYTVDFTHGPTVADRMEPYFLRSSFALTRGAVFGGGRPWQLDLLISPSSPDPGMVGVYQQLGGAFLEDLEQVNALRIYVRGSLPLYVAEAEENGYAGLNTTDRGLLSTIGPMSGTLSRAQILAHELAHYQNARSSQLEPRWLQEGMSEWSSERLLYRHFPARAVYRFLQRLRFERLVGTGTDDTFPLEKWGTEVASLGYEKSLAFLDLLEARIGQAPLIKAFQQAVNEPMDTPGFRAFLEGETGKDLGYLFAGWVEEGARDPTTDPDILFADPDEDGLMTLDEQQRGTDPAVADSDADGYPDGEEVFQGTNPLASSIDAEGLLTETATPVLAGQAGTALSPLFRLGGGRGETFTYSFDPNDPTPAVVFARPLLLRPPYAVSVQGHSGLEASSLVTLSRSLMVNGTPQTIVPPADAILPATPRTTISLHPGATLANTVGQPGGLALRDTSGDLPTELAAYDLTESLVTKADGELALVLKTAAKPDALGEFGDYVVTFSQVSWFDGSVQLHSAETKFALSVSGGAPYWSVYDDAGSRTTALLKAGVTFGFGDDLRITLDDTLLADWLNGSGDKVVCIATEVAFDGGDKFQEQGGCVTIASPGLTVRAAQLADAYGLGVHTVEAFVQAAAAADTRAQGVAELGVSALQEFERALGRPLLERNHWPVHIRYKAAGAAIGAGSARVGAFLEIRTGEEGPTLDYLVVEQLARVVTADILAKSGPAPYWVQEVFIQWLASAAMYALYPTADVHDFHADRLTQYQNCLGSACNVLDEPLSQWTSASPAGAPDSEKALAFTLELDSRLGSAPMSQAFSTFAHGIPDGDGFKQRLKNFSPGNQAIFAGLWQTWVTGSGNPTADKNAINARLNVLIPP